MNFSARFKIFVVAVLLVCALLMAGAVQAAEICVKKKVKQSRSGAINMQRALMLVESGCPRGFAAIDRSVASLSLQGPQGPVGPAGEPGPTITETDIYLAGNAGIPWDDASNSELVVDPQSTGTVRLSARSSPGVFYFYLPIELARIMNGGGIYIKELAVTYKVSNAASFISEISVEKASGVNQADTVLVDPVDLKSTESAQAVYQIAPGALSLVDGAMQVRFALSFADTSHMIYISEVRLRIGAE